MPTSWLGLLRWSLSSPTDFTVPVSSVDYPCPWFHANSCVRGPAANSRQLLSPTNSLLAFRYLFRPRRDFKSKNPLSGFAPKQTKESSAWRATYIVLHVDQSVAGVAGRSGLLPEWMLLLACWRQRAEMQELSCCRSADVSRLRCRNWSALGLLLRRVQQCW